jgi:hypothetical protein
MRGGNPRWKSTPKIAAWRIPMVKRVWAKRYGWKKICAYLRISRYTLHKIVHGQGAYK